MSFVRSICLAILTLWLVPASALEYVIDPNHTYAYFEIDHLGFSTQHGRFNQTGGSIEVDDAAHVGHVEISIDTASIDTGMALRDDILRGETWFNAPDFPKIIFRSDKLVFEQDKLVAVDGTLALLGVIRPMHLTINRYKCGLNMALRKRGCGADAEGVLHRSDFGFTTGAPFVGDEVRLRIQVEAYPR